MLHPVWNVYRAERRIDVELTWESNVSTIDRSYKVLGDISAHRMTSACRSDGRCPLIFMAVDVFIQESHEASLIDPIYIGTRIVDI